MGTGRGIAALVQKYLERTRFDKGFKPPTTVPETMYGWSSRFKWAERAAQFDAEWEARKNAEREAVIGYGLALEYERVRELMQLAELLRGQIYEQNPESGVFHNLWVPDVKSIGRGEFAEKVDIERFNPALVEQYRKVLEDIAKEVGGRVVHSDITTGGEKLSAPNIFLPAVSNDSTDDAGD